MYLYLVSTLAVLITVSSVYEVSNTTLTMLAERCYGPAGVLSSLSEPCCTVGPTSPLPLAMLDALTAHAKFRSVIQVACDAHWNFPFTAHKVNICTL